MNVLIYTILTILLYQNPACLRVQDNDINRGTEYFDESTNATIDPDVIYERFFALFSQDGKQRESALRFIDRNWQEECVVIVLDILSLTHESWITENLVRLLQKKTGKDWGFDLNAWYKWIWNRPQKIFDNYGDFKGQLFSYIDPRFELYFSGRTQSAAIRLDEVRWGGVTQDGIPPLRNPKMITADEAGYLEDDNVVFGIEVNGDMRAYPKRVLAWHEMFVDEVGGVPVVGVYCTLCGTVILYKTDNQGIHFDLGTSGFLYRSNKLMYDRATQSLWNTLWGKPVIGSLVVQNIELEVLSVVTTSWSEWRKRHPETLVMSLETGYNRNYDEGVAYRDYFSTDNLMFNTPFTDQRLKNKDEVLIVRAPGFESEPLAIYAGFLNDNSIYSDQIGITSFVVITDGSGGNRVYQTDGREFVSKEGARRIKDEFNNFWSVFEDKLVNDEGDEYSRLPYHRSFWFAWFAAFPDTRLVK